VNKDFHRPIYDNKGTSEVSYACLWVSRVRVGASVGRKVSINASDARN